MDKLIKPPTRAQHFQGKGDLRIAYQSWSPIGDARALPRWYAPTNA